MNWRIPLRWAIPVLLFAVIAPRADFYWKKETHVAPADIRFINNSVSADSFIWQIDNEVVCRERDLDFRFETSGNYTVKLIAIKGKDTDTLEQRIQIYAPHRCRVLMKTSLGDMLFELSEDTPLHRRNFLELAGADFYDSLLFHRVIAGFMIQGGDNNTRPAGHTEQSFPVEIPAEISHQRPHYRGALAAARMPDEVNPEKTSSGTQFYIVEGHEITREEIERVQATKQHAYTPWQVEKYLEVGGAPQLDEEYTVFGYMLEGWDVLNNIASSPTDPLDKPLNDIYILDIIFID